MIHALPPDVVREAERLAVAAAPEDALMLRAARGVADAVERLGGPSATVVALVGGGANGGDALHAAAMLVRRGLDVRVALLSDHPHPRALAAAVAAGVDIRDLPLPLDEGAPGWLAGDLWIDGLTGTGLRGPLREPLAGAVRALGRARKVWRTRVVAVDVPSGCLAADGTLDGEVLGADHTVTMGAAKTPLFLPPAAQYTGTVDVVDLGLDLGSAVGTAPGPAPAPGPAGGPGPDPDAGPAPALVPAPGPTPTPAAEAGGAPGGPREVLRPEAADIALTLRVPGAFDHKYTRGVVTVAAGSDTYPGAGVLATMGALGMGPGMVRLESAGRTARIVLDRHPGVVTASGRSQAALLGSGLDAEIEPRIQAVARRALARGIPLVLDAGALGFVAGLVEEHGSLDRVVLTPHAGEAATLLSRLEDREVGRPEVEADALAALGRLVTLTGATVVLKGSVTLVSSPDGRVFSVAGTTGWTGVAGSGDVLAGAMASLLSQRRAEEERGGAPVDIPFTAAAAVWIHARAALLAAGQDPRNPTASAGSPIQAEDLAGMLPGVVAGLLEEAAEVHHHRRRTGWDRSPEPSRSDPQRL